MTETDFSLSDAATVVELARQASVLLGTAESLTGGLICSELTSIPGASDVVRGGIVSYATEVKQRVLQVDEQLLARGGAVQAQVAEQMALGAGRHLGAELTLSCTGVAGPTPQDGKPVGCVFLGMAQQQADGSWLTEAKELALTGSRAQIRAQTVVAALAWFTHYLRVIR